MPQMNPDAIMDMISKSQGANPEQEMSMDSMQGMPPDMGGDMGGAPPMDPSMMGMDSSMMPPSQPTSGYDDGEAMKLLQQLNLPAEAIEQLLSSLYSSSGQDGMSMGTSPAAESQAGNMQLLQELIGSLAAQQPPMGMDPSMMGMDPSMMPPPIPPQPPMPPMGGPPMPPMPPQGMPPMPPMS